MFSFNAFNLTDFLTLFLTILFFLTALALAVSVHEASHALAANLRGDPTARLAGRMTLNPIAHVDPIGTLLVPLIMVFISRISGSFFIFGWAKPTPVNLLNFHRPLRDAAVVSLAGPASNFLLATIIAIIYRIFPNDQILLLIYLNLILALFNLIPIPPLDGFKILLGILPKKIALQAYGLEAYGPFILIIFLFFLFPIFSPYLSLIMGFLISLLTGATI